MSGTLDIRDNVTWMPTGWIYDGVLQGIVKTLEGQDQSLAILLREAQTDRVQYGDLRSLSVERFHILLSATEQAYLQAVSDGPTSFYKPMHYPWFMSTFSELKTLLRIDERIRSRKDSVGRIIVNHHATWTASGWVFDMTLEHFAAGVSLENISFAEELIAARISEDHCGL